MARGTVSPLSGTDAVDSIAQETRSTMHLRCGDVEGAVTVAAPKLALEAAGAPSSILPEGRSTKGGSR